MIHRRFVRRATTALVVMMALASCGQKAAPDIDPPSKNDAAPHPVHVTTIQ